MKKTKHIPTQLELAVKSTTRHLNRMIELQIPLDDDAIAKLRDLELLVDAVLAQGERPGGRNGEAEKRKDQAA